MSCRLLRTARPTATTDADTVPSAVTQFAKLVMIFLTDIILDGQEGHNRIADQMLKDERTFTQMQGMLAGLVYKAFRGPKHN